MNSDRLPNAVIINGGDKGSRKDAADFLALRAVCCSDIKSRPCGYCRHCIKAIDDCHPDITYAVPKNKTKTISMEQLREELIPDFYIKPNESDTKVYIFSEADSTLRADHQNALLKSIEEPPQGILFIFTTENAVGLLTTIRSRAQLFSLPVNSAVDKDTDELAKEILAGIISIHESDLLFTTGKFKSKDMIKEVIPQVSEYLTDALSVSVGNRSDSDIINRFGKSVSRLRIIKMINMCDEILYKANTNINLNILNTYICSTLRRIKWQK